MCFSLVIIAQLVEQNAVAEQLADCLVHDSEQYFSFLLFFSFNYFYFAYGPYMLLILFLKYIIGYYYGIVDIFTQSTCFQYS